MLNYRTTQLLAAEHRAELMREAEQERLARAATAGHVSAVLHAVEVLQRALFTFARRTAHRHSVAHADAHAA